jgi:hypothetical protein
MGDGPTLYRGLRDELRYYFGDGLVGVLDGMEGSRERGAGSGPRPTAP